MVHCCKKVTVAFPRGWQRTNQIYMDVCKSPLRNWDLLRRHVHVLKDLAPGTLLAAPAPHSNVSCHVSPNEPGGQHPPGSSNPRMGNRVYSFKKLCPAVHRHKRSNRSPGNTTEQVHPVHTVKVFTKREELPNICINSGQLDWSRASLQ
jgi:hypothetical protein